MLVTSKNVCQALAAVLCTAAFVNARVLDAITASVWDYCKVSAIFQHDTWEPGLVVVVWLVFTGCWCVDLESLTYTAESKLGKSLILTTAASHRKNLHLH